MLNFCPNDRGWGNATSLPCSIQPETPNAKSKTKNDKILIHITVILKYLTSKFGFFRHTLIDRVSEEECNYLAIYSKYFVKMAEKEMSSNKSN